MSTLMETSLRTRLRDLSTTVEVTSIQPQCRGTAAGLDSRGGLSLRGSRSSVIAHNGLGLMPPRHGCEAAVAIFRDPGSVETRGKIATTLACLAMTEWEVVPLRPVCHCGLRRGVSVCHCARSAFRQVPSDGSRVLPVRHVERSRDISQPRSAAEDCHGPAGLAKTKKTEDCRGSRCTSLRTLWLLAGAIGRLKSLACPSCRPEWRHLSAPRPLRERVG
jgi:hypothetical protein